MEKSVEMLEETVPEKKEEIPSFLVTLIKSLQLEDKVLETDILVSPIIKELKEVYKLMGFLKIHDKAIAGLKKAIELLENEKNNNTLEISKRSNKNNSEDEVKKEEFGFMNILYEEYKKNGIDI